MFKNITLLGAQGFIGSYIKKTFIQKGIKLNCFDKEDLDINNKKQISNKIKKNTELIIHGAALCGANESEKKPEKFLKTNFIGTVNIIEDMKNKKIKNLIFLSSLTVFGCSNKAVNEESSYNGRHVYSKTKILCENFIKIFCKIHKINYIILRPTLVVGPGMKELHALGDFCKKIKNNNVLKIFGKGKHKRDFVHPYDVSSCIYKATKFLFNNRKINTFEEFNLSNNEPISMLHLAFKIKNFFKTGKLKFVKKNYQTFSLFTENKRVMNKLNFRSKYSIKDIINDIKC